MLPGFDKMCGEKAGKAMAKFEVIVMCGIPGSGKTTFCRERLFPNYIYISLDRLKTRSAEAELFSFAMRRHKSCVVDNTNIDPRERSRYIPAAREAGASVVAYWFEPDVDACLAKNARRTGKERVPDFVVGAKAKRFVAPTKAEGFDGVFKVLPTEGGFGLEEQQ